MCIILGRSLFIMRSIFKSIEMLFNIIKPGATMRVHSVLNNLLKWSRCKWQMSHIFQKTHWETYLKNYNESQPIGFEWGDPDDENDRHGNYKAVKDLLLSRINEESTVLEIGTLSGKWTQFMFSAKKIIAVDINKFFIEYLSRKYPQVKNIEFYVSSGNELKGIDSGSVDLVFSMDTFSRVKKQYIYDYFKEISRVLTRGGEAILFMPNNDLPISKDRGFTAITTKWIEKHAKKYFSNFVIDSKTLKHGSILICKK